MNILADFYCPAALDDDYKFSESGIYHQLSPESDHKVHCMYMCRILFLSFIIQVYMTYIRGLPINDTPEMFGLHENANITFALNETSNLLSGLMLLQPKSSQGSGTSREAVRSFTPEAIIYMYMYMKYS